VTATGEDGDTAQFRRRLSDLRSARGLSQEQLARRLGVSFVTVNRWEGGRTRPSARAWRELKRLESEPAVCPGACAVPEDQSRFVGRHRELAEVVKLMDGARLVSLTGAGGVGKTRLAVEAVRRCGFGGPVTFVPLGAAREPGQVAAGIAAALGLRDKPGASAADAILPALDGMARLLVLDGVEHVSGEVAGFARRALAAAPRLRLLVTSQRLLGVPGERACPVPPLGCPAPGETAARIAASDAVELFVTRARERTPGFTLGRAAPEAVGELCRDLEGMPLAIELAAGWISTLSVEEILRRRPALLGPSGGPDRGERTLRAVVRASYDLLDEGERDLVQRLSVFAGPFTIDDAQAVAGPVADLDDDRQVPVLMHRMRALIDSSWLTVRREDEVTRYGMLDSLRDYAAEQLHGRGPEAAAEAARRHAAHYAQLAQDSERGLASAQRPEWVARMEAGEADLHAALRWAETEGETVLGLETSAALWQWWLSSGRLLEGRGWIARFLAAARAAGGSAALTTARAQSAAAVLAAESGDYPDAVARAAVALRIFEAHAQIERAALAATILGSAHRYLGHRTEARTYFERAMRHRGVLGDERGVSIAVNNLALVALDDGDLPRARDLFEQSLLIKRRLGDARSVAIGLANLSDVLIRTRRHAAAGRALTEASALATELGDRQLFATLACNRGELAGVGGQWEAAAECYGAAAQSARAGGHSHDVVVALAGLGRALHHLGRQAEAAGHLREAEALAAGLGAAARLAEVRAALTEIGEDDAAAPPRGLTPRQGEVLGWLAAGLTNREIAERLRLSVPTVERHLATIYRNLDLRGRVEAAQYAARNGLRVPKP
jgi:predicted ATPase/DNA-binding CsgD family transcriptional regulator/DNA-binding XRE family transcriptional regulator